MDRRDLSQHVITITHPSFDNLFRILHRCMRLKSPGKIQNYGITHADEQKALRCRQSRCK